MIRMQRSQRGERVVETLRLHLQQLDRVVEVARTRNVPTERNRISTEHAGQIVVSADTADGVDLPADTRPRSVRISRVEPSMSVSMKVTVHAGSATSGASTSTALHPCTRRLSPGRRRPRSRAIDVCHAGSLVDHGGRTIPR